MKGRDIVVIGASAGGLQALRQLVADLPGTFPGTLFVVVHSSPDAPGMLPEILAGAGDLPVQHAVDGETFHPGRIYVAPPDRHLIFDDGRLGVTLGPRENGFRPAVDPLFRTAARTHGHRVIGVVLSGGLDDGTLGLAAIKDHGGMAIVQDLQDAAVRSMPESAIENVDVDHVVPARELARLLVRLVQQTPASAGETMSAKRRPDVADKGSDAIHHDGYGVPPSSFTCPECGGALWELGNGKLVRYRCHVGHGYTAQGLVDGQRAHVEGAMWTALRALEETSELRRRLGKRARDFGMRAIAERYEAQALDYERRAKTIRNVLVEDDGEPARPRVEVRQRRRVRGPSRRRRAQRKK